MIDFIQGSLSFANILLALFVLFFAVSFLRKTKETNDRNPWLFLLVAVLVFFTIQVLKILELLGYVHLDTYMFYLDSMFIAIVLFTFIFQYTLILSSELIQIKRKSSNNDKDIGDLESKSNSVELIEKNLKKEEKQIISEEKELEKFTKLAKKSTKGLKNKASVKTVHKKSFK